MTLSKAEALALAEFAGIDLFERGGVKHACHGAPWAHMRLSDYLLTAEGALRLLNASGWNSRVWAIPVGSDTSFVPATIIAAALQLPAVQELVKKMEESNG